jgi:hypothetical protein
MNWIELSKDTANQMELENVIKKTKILYIYIYIKLLDAGFLLGNSWTNNGRQQSILNQRSRTWGMCTLEVGEDILRGKRKHLMGYAKLKKRIISWEKRNNQG